jgi:hypothetical protein
VPKHILDPDFKYVPAAKTNAEYLAKKFKRIERELKQQQQSPRNPEVGIVRPLQWSRG